MHYEAIQNLLGHYIAYVGKSICLFSNPRKTVYPQCVNLGSLEMVRHFFSNAIDCLEVEEEICLPSQGSTEEYDSGSSTTSSHHATANQEKGDLFETPVEPPGTAHQVHDHTGHEFKTLDPDFANPVVAPSAPDPFSQIPDFLSSTIQSNIDISGVPFFPQGPGDFFDNCSSLEYYMPSNDFEFDALMGGGPVGSEEFRLEDQIYPS